VTTYSLQRDQVGLVESQGLVQICEAQGVKNILEGENKLCKTGGARVLSKNIAQLVRDGYEHQVEKQFQARRYAFLILSVTDSCPGEWVTQNKTTEPRLKLTFCLGEPTDEQWAGG
jgi:hypothetical protein